MINKENWQDRFDKEFPNMESGYLNQKGENVHIFMPAVDAREVKTFIQQELNKQREEYDKTLKRAAKVKKLCIMTLEQLGDYDKQNKTTDTIKALDI